MSNYLSSEQIKWPTFHFEVYRLNPSQEGTLCMLNTVQSNKIHVLSISFFSPCLLEKCDAPLDVLKEGFDACVISNWHSCDSALFPAHVPSQSAVSLPLLVFNTCKLS